MSTPLSQASTCHYVVKYKLEFSQSGGGGMYWNIIRRVIEFTDILFKKQAEKALQDDHLLGQLEESRLRPVLQETEILSVKSRAYELCDDVDYILASGKYCAHLKATISTSASYQQGSRSSERSNCSSDFLNFVFAASIQSYIQRQEYPIFVEGFSLQDETRLAFTTTRLGILLTGAIYSEMDVFEEQAFKLAVVDFLDDTNESSSSLTLISNQTQVVVGPQSLFDGYQKLANGDFDIGLEVNTLIFRQLAVEPEAAISLVPLVDSSSYGDEILSRFNEHADVFLRDYLVGSNEFFYNVRAVQAKRIVESSPMPSPTINPTAAVDPPKHDIESLFIEPEGALKFRVVATLVLLVPFLIIATGFVIIWRLNQCKRKGKGQVDRQEEAIDVCTGT